MLNGCAQCLAKQQQIDKLVEKVERLEQKLGYQKRHEREGVFGSSTPSAKKPFKPNTQSASSDKKRGGQPGHPGHKRKAADPAVADSVVAVPSAHQGCCPQCGGALQHKGQRRRRIRECRPVASQEIILELPVERCPRCKRDFHTPAPGVFAKALIGNQLLANAVEMTYLHGIPL